MNNNQIYNLGAAGGIIMDPVRLKIDPCKIFASRKHCRTTKAFAFGQHMLQNRTDLM